MSRDAALKIALWVVPVLFGMGALYQTVLGSSSDLAAVQQKIESHEDLKAHPVTEERLETIAVEQRALRVEQAEQGENIAAICAAIEGAKCK